jgi:hypothetical protein
LTVFLVALFNFFQTFVLNITIHWIVIVGGGVDRRYTSSTKSATTQSKVTKELSRYFGAVRLSPSIAAGSGPILRTPDDRGMVMELRWSDRGIPKNAAKNLFQCHFARNKCQMK